MECDRAPPRLLADDPVLGAFANVKRYVCVWVPLRQKDPDDMFGMKTDKKGNLHDRNDCRVVIRVTKPQSPDKIRFVTN